MALVTMSGESVAVDIVMVAMKVVTLRVVAIWFPWTMSHSPSARSPPAQGWAPPPPPHRLRSLARSWLDEDAPWPDAAVATVGDCATRAQLLSKGGGDSGGVLAGAPFAEAVFGVSGCRVIWRVPEGAALPPGRVLVAEVEGPAAGVLGGERVALNILGRCSGVASMAARAVGVARAQGWAGVVGGTRKTTPGFRLAEKYALGVGGADPHRGGLGGLLLLKDNHRALAAAAGGLEQMILGVRRAGGFTRRLGVECSSVDEALEAAGAGADIVLLDNLAPQDLHAAAAQVKAAYPGVTVEASGGIVLGTLPQFLGPHIDVVSMGCLTHSAPALDFALRVLEP
ncbi:nicotinate-nucleotide pyrophosphorylase [carboxylating] [Catharus ustulatus]|uniref:nicotinate-nucleotide pyrophosphorylase [carboxylating] n=1 Tax=Catharus ustulatus TaxID=91951 RepID=UPI001407BE89|nr:nicotinate-nucleotide pyrophosphorylase [carboxylating] [Catharus ustulatus]